MRRRFACAVLALLLARCGDPAAPPSPGASPAGPGWQPLPAMPTGRNHVAGGAVGARLFAGGGRPPNTVPTGVFPQNEVYDPRTNTWESRAAMRTPRHGIGAAVVNGRVFVPGGAILQGFGATAVFDVYDPPAAKTCE